MEHHEIVMHLFLLHDFIITLLPENMIISIQCMKYPLLHIHTQLQSIKLKFDYFCFAINICHSRVTAGFPNQQVKVGWKLNVFCKLARNHNLLHVSAKVHFILAHKTRLLWRNLGTIGIKGNCL